MYIPSSNVVSHSLLVDSHDASLAFDYSNEYFYFLSRQRASLVFNNSFFEYSGIPPHYA